MDMDDLIALAKFAENYNELRTIEGFIGISDTGIQMRIDVLCPLVRDPKNIVRAEARDSAGYPLKFVVCIFGVPFFALADFSDVMRLGLGPYLTPTLTKEFALYLFSLPLDTDELIRPL